MFPTSILLSSTRTPSPKLRSLSLTSTAYIYLATVFKRPFTTKKQTHSYLHHQSSHPRHSKNSLPYSQLLRLRRLCSADDHDFTTIAQEMCGFFQEQGYPSDLLREDLRKISSLNRHDTIYSHREENSQAGRVPLVLTYHPLNEKIKRILLNNFRILNIDPETGRIFTDAPLIAYRRDRNIRNVLVHTTVGSQSADPAGTVPCNHPWCPTCQHVSSSLTVNGPNLYHQHQRTFQLPFQQLSLLHLVPSLPCSLHRGNRSNPPRTFRRTPQKHREKNLPVSPLLSTLMA